MYTREYHPRLGIVFFENSNATGKASALYIRLKVDSAGSSPRPTPAGPEHARVSAEIARIRTARPRLLLLGLHLCKCLAQICATCLVLLAGQGMRENLAAVVLQPAIRKEE